MKVRNRLFTITSALLFSVSMTTMAADFTYDGPGKLLPGSGTGRVDSKVYFNNMRFPLEKAPAYANSQVYKAGGGFGPGGGQCAASNYSYPWQDNFCESRGHRTSMCPSGTGHQGQDIRPATCEDNKHWVVATENGSITNIGSYTVTLTGDSGLNHRYMHMNMRRLAVKRGQRVVKGQKFGLVSDDFGGASTTRHLHYELRNGSLNLPTYMSLVKSYEALLGNTGTTGNSPTPPPVTNKNTYKRAVTASPADFDGDGYDDIYWYRYGNATDYLWYGKGRAFQSARRDSGGEFTPITGDFNGDGMSDIFWYRTGGNYDYVWLSEGRTFKAVRRQVLGDYLPISGDFDGNGVDDIFWYKPGAGQDVIFYGNTTGQFTAVNATVNQTYIPVAADFDNNGRDDIFWYAPGSAKDSIWKGKGHGFVNSPIQITGTYKPVSGDYNGDGKGDIFWYAPGAAADYISYSNGAGFTYAPKNVVPIIGSYDPVKGDFDGDGYSDILWFKPNTANDDWVYYGTAGHNFIPVKKSVASAYLAIP